MTIGIIIHWFAALCFVAMGTYSLIEARSSSLIPKALFLWPLAGFIFGFTACLSPVIGGGHLSGKPTLFILGVVMILCSAQAFLVNIRKISRWPSGAVWLLFIFIAVLYQSPYGGIVEPVFQTFLRRLTGFLWAAIGITKVIGEKTISSENSVPPWIVLLYLQAILIASFSS